MVPPRKPFPLLKLPSQALNKTFAHIGKLDLIPLSLLSKKAARFIHLNSTAPKGYEVKFTDKKKSIRVTFDDTFFLWKFEKKQALPQEYLEYNIQDVTVKCCKTESGFITVYTKNSRGPSEAEIFYNVFRFFLKTFPAGITELHLDLTMESEKAKKKNKENGFLILLAHTEPTFCDNLILSGVPEGNILNDALMNIVVSKILTIQSQVPKNFVLPETVHAQCLIIQKGDWILTSGSIFSVNAKYCRLENVSLKEKCVDIIQRFLNFPSAPSLEWVMVELHSGNLNIREVLKGLDAHEWNAGRRDGYFTQFHGEELVDIDCRNGYDIQRDDGLLATVFLTKPEKDRLQQFHMIIWHNRFPNAENLKLKQEKFAHLTVQEQERNRKLRENEAKIRENEDAMERMRMEIEELRAENAAQRLSRDAFESMVVLLKKLKTDDNSN